MPRRLTNFAFNACIGLFMLFAVAWPITHTVGYTVVFAWRGRAILLDTCRGEISLWTAPVVASRELGNGKMWASGEVYDRAAAQVAIEWYRQTKMQKRGQFAMGVGLVRSEQLMPPIANNVVPGSFGY